MSMLNDDNATNCIQCSLRMKRHKTILAPVEIGFLGAICGYSGNDNVEMHWPVNDT